MESKRRRGECRGVVECARPAATSSGPRFETKKKKGGGGFERRHTHFKAEKVSRRSRALLYLLRVSSLKGTN